EVGLKSDKIVHSPRNILAPKLNHRKGLLSRPLIDKADRLERPVTQGIISPSRHYLNRHATLENLNFLLRRLVKVLQFGLSRVYKLVVKKVVLLACHGAVYIVGLALIVARAEIGNIHVYACCVDYRRGSIEKTKLAT